MNTEIEVTPEQIIREYEDKIIQQMTLHHIQLQNKDLEIARLKGELVVVYESLLQAYVKNPRAVAMCEEKLREFGGR